VPSNTASEAFERTASVSAIRDVVVSDEDEDEDDIPVVIEVRSKGLVSLFPASA
jgi:hypothetical protein